MSPSISSKALLFSSFQKDQKNTKGASFHNIVFLPSNPGKNQEWTKWAVLKGITHWTPNKANKQDHTSPAILQWSRMWEVSSLALHKKTPIYQCPSSCHRLSVVKILSLKGPCKEADPRERSPSSNFLSQKTAIGSGQQRFVERSHGERPPHLPHPNKKIIHPIPFLR